MTKPASIDVGPDPVPTSAGDEDARWLARFAAGEADAARRLIERLGPKAYSVALRVTGNPADAQDIAQEAMLRLWRAAADWRETGAKVSTWLYRVTMNLSIDHKRRSRGGMAALDDVAEPADPAPGAAEHLQLQARSDALQQALMVLPDRQRQAVVLRHIEELGNPEIAEIMGIGVEAVESLTARGKRALKAAMADQREALGYEDD